MPPLVGKKKKKLDVAGSTPPASLNDAFSGLSLEGLPEGPAIAAPDADTVSSTETGQGKRGEVILRRETAHRAGKAVIIVEGLAALESERVISDLAAGLKKHCGCGGTVKDDEIIIQGEKAAQVAEFLRGEGFRVRGVTQ
ncbi:MAG: translation initiation factor [Verrucomicrobiota bacterium]